MKRKYLDYIYEQIAYIEDLELSEKELTDYVENELTKYEIFQKFLEEEGLGKYSDTIKSWIQDIYNIEL